MLQAYLQAFKEVLNHNHKCICTFIDITLKAQLQELSKSATVLKYIMKVIMLSIIYYYKSRNIKMLIVMAYKH